MVTARIISLAWMLVVATIAVSIEAESCLDVEGSEDTVVVESLKAAPQLVTRSDQPTGVELTVTLSDKVQSRCVVDLSVKGADEAVGSLDVLKVVFSSLGAVATTTFFVTPIRDKVFDNEKRAITVRVSPSGDVEPATIIVEDGDKRPDTVLISATTRDDYVEIVAEIEGEVTLAQDSMISLRTGGDTEPTDIIIPAKTRVGSLTIGLAALSSSLMLQIDSVANGERNEWQILEPRSDHFARIERSHQFDQVNTAILRDALSKWVGTNKPKEEDNPHSRDLRAYLKKAYNVMGGGPLSEALLGLLGTADVNRTAARLYDTERFHEARKLGTELAYRSYLSAFPGGLNEETASEELSALLARVDNQCRSVEITDCKQCPDMIALGTRSPIGPLAVSVYEITEGQFRLFRDEPREDCWLYKETDDGWAWRKQDWITLDGTHDDYPAVCVSWYDARNYTAWLSDESNREYRLLKDVEWVEISDACETVEGNFMSSETEAIECHKHMSSSKEQRCGGGVTSGDEFLCNSIGIFDLYGNVWEWMDDRASSGDELRVVRGGSWVDDVSVARDEGRVYPEIRTGFTGFRVARSTTECPGGVTLRASKTRTVESEKAILEISAEIEIKKSDTDVQVIFSGDAELGADYIVSTDKIMIPRNKRSGSLTITVVDDELYENTETIRIDGKAEGLAVTGVEIRLEVDERDSGVALTVVPGEVDEGGGPQSLAIEAKLSHATTETLEVHLGFGGIAVEGIDYRVVPRTPTISIPAGSSSGTGSLTIEPIEDDIDEGVGETIEIKGAVRAPHMMNVISAGIQIKEI